MKYCGLWFTVSIITVLTVSFSKSGNKPTPVELKYNPALGKPFIPAYNPLTHEGIYLGRLLFYDPMLSGNNKQSCGSCHIQKYAFTDGKPLATGAFGDTVNRNTMSLVNLAWNYKFFWDGRTQFLEDVIPQPIINPKEMAQDTNELIKELRSHKHYPKLFIKAFPDEAITMNTVNKAIAQFLRTIVSNGIQLPDSIFNKAEYAHKDSVLLEANYRKENSLRGSFYRLAFMCSSCHSGTNYGGLRMADNMIETGTKFKAPSLLNIKLTAPYMHDGSLKNIEEVLQHYDKHISDFHHQNPRLLPQPVPNLISEYDRQNFDKLLDLFTDSSVLTNKSLSDPFVFKRFNTN